MTIAYFEQITDELDELIDLEHSLRGRPTQVRVQMLRLLKSAEVANIERAAPVVGYSTQQLRRWWRLYSNGGLTALTEEKPKGGSTPRLTEQAWKALEQVMQEGHIARIEDARVYLRREHQIDYKSLNGVWHHLRKHGVRLKTGRRTHQLSDPAAQAAFKKSVRP